MQAFGPEEARDVALCIKWGLGVFMKRHGFNSARLGLAASVAMALSVAGLTTPAAATPTVVFDFGELTDGASFSGALAPNEIAWFSFTLSSGTFVDITTALGANSLFQEDTLIGLYDNDGNLIAFDNDDGFDGDGADSDVFGGDGVFETSPFRSTLSFGTGSGEVLGDPTDLGGDGIANGEDGALPFSIRYFVAVGEFDVMFGETDFDVVSSDADLGGDFTLSFLTDNISEVPIPGGALFMISGLAAGLLGRARQRQRAAG